MHTYGFSESHCRDLLKRIPRKFILYFSKLYYNFHAFYNFMQLCAIFKLKGNRKRKEKHGIVRGSDLAQGLVRPTWPNSQYRPKAPARQCVQSVVSICTHARAVGGAVACSLPALWWSADSAVFIERSSVEWGWCRQGGGWRRSPKRRGTSEEVVTASTVELRWISSRNDD
jgi:hypothetical protein